MKALILAAGKGTRLGDMTAAQPKCLVEIAGRPILDYQLEALHAAGVHDIVVVAGYLADQVVAHAAGRYRVLTNDLYETSNSIYSLWIARAEANGQDFLLLNGDVVADPELLVELVRCPTPCAALVNEQKTCLDGEMNVVIENGRITAFSKQVPASEASAESAQLTRFGAHESTLLFSRVEKLVEDQAIQHFPAHAYAAIFAESEMAPVYSRGRWHFEIDTPEDHGRCEAFLTQRAAHSGDRTPAHFPDQQTSDSR